MITCGWHWASQDKATSERAKLKTEVADYEDEHHDRYEDDHESDDDSPIALDIGVGRGG